MSVFLKSLRAIRCCPNYINTSTRQWNVHLSAKIRTLQTTRTMNCQSSAEKHKMSKTNQQSIPIEGGQQKTKKIALYVLLITATLLGYHAFLYVQSKPATKSTKKTKQLSKYSADDVKQHNSIRTGVWVTLGHVVYDVTEYVTTHPGGEMILLAAGGALEPFWEKYPVHKRKEMENILGEYKIGVIPMEESKELLSHTVKMLEKAFDPVKLTLNPEDYRLEIVDVGTTFVKHLTIHDIRTKFPKQDLEATIKCAAKADQTSEKPTWSGTLLKDVLTQGGVPLSGPDLQYLHFMGLDRGFIASVPVDEVLKEQSRVLLAYQRDGEELHPKHGYPIRVIIPTDTGFKSVKWLGKIVIGKEKLV